MYQLIGINLETGNPQAASDEFWQAVVGQLRLTPKQVRTRASSARCELCVCVWGGGGGCACACACAGVERQPAVLISCMWLKGGRGLPPEGCASNRPRWLVALARPRLERSAPGRPFAAAPR